MTSGRIPFVSSLLNSALVLFFVGVFAFLALAGNVVVDAMLEGLPMKIIMADVVLEAEGKHYADSLAHEVYARQVWYVSKAEALKGLQVGNELLEATDGLNPLPAVVHVKLKAVYINPDSVAALSQPLLDDSRVQEVYYPIQEIEDALATINRLKWAALGLGLLLAVVAMFLILNTVRLAIYARRLVIRSMQLIGATSGYIRAPFLRMGVLQGLAAGLLADLLIYLMMLIMAGALGDAVDLSLITGHITIKFLFLALVLFGGLLGLVSSWLAVNRFLNRNPEQLI